MARIKDVVFDSVRPAFIARFWAAALDGYEVAPYDDAELTQLRDLGFSGPEDDPTVMVWAGPDTHPRLFFQLVPEPKVVKNRVHLDLAVDDIDAEVDRLQALGATVRRRDEQDLVTLADPEGNEFCIVC